MIYKSEYHSPIGKLTLASDGNALVGLWIEGQKYFAKGYDLMVEKCELPIFKQVIDWLDGYFSGCKKDFNKLKLAPAGNEFQQLVWQKLLLIPYGKTITYGDIAKELSNITSKNMSARAVGNAVAHNPISIIIPCHRVLGKKGLTGYAGGLDKKTFLLKLEISTHL